MLCMTQHELVHSTAVSEFLLRFQCSEPAKEKLTTMKKKICDEGLSVL